MRNEGCRMELGPDSKAGKNPTMVFLGSGLMCKYYSVPPLSLKDGRE